MLEAKRTAFFLGLAAFSAYLTFGTRFFSYFPQELDYYNHLSQAWLNGRLDLVGLAKTQDLALFEGKWYPFFGPLPAIPILIWQVMTGSEWVYTLPIVAIVAAIGVGLTYLVLSAAEKTYFAKSTRWPFRLTLLFAFGMVQFWVATRSAVWFQVQVYTYALTAMGMLPILKKKITFRDYGLSVGLLALNLFTRPHVALLALIPIGLYFHSHRRMRIKDCWKLVWPVLVMGLVFSAYNWARFRSPIDTGYAHQQYHPHYRVRVENAGGWFSLVNIPYNLHFLAFELPRIDPSGRVRFNPEGNSIFALTPPLLGIFLAAPWMLRRAAQRRLGWWLWAGVIVTLMPTMLLSGTGWIQIGYRYTLDVTVILGLLMLFGWRRLPAWLFYPGAVWAVFVYAQAAWLT